MTHKEYIINKINELVSKFPFISARYQNHYISNTNLIEIEPLEFYQSNDEFNAWEDNTVFEFMDLYPDQTLAFISKNAIVGIDKVDYQIINNIKPQFTFTNSPVYLEVEADFVSNVPHASNLSFNKSIFISTNRKHANFIDDFDLHLSKAHVDLGHDFWKKNKIFEPTSQNFIETHKEIIVDNNSYRMAA